MQAPTLPPRLPSRAKGVGPPPLTPPKPPPKPKSKLPLSTTPALPSRAFGVSTSRALSPSQSIRRSSPLSFTDIDFTAVDAYARDLPDAYATDPTTLARALVHPFTSSTEVIKFRALFTWVATHIDYDVAAFMSRALKPQHPADTLRSRRAVCSGYAGLVRSLCEVVGIACVEVSGYGKGFGYVLGAGTAGESNHAWNAVKVGGDDWRMVDACWGAGYIDTTTFHRQFDPFYFLTHPTLFRYNHMPTNPQHQFTHQHITWPDFFALPDISSNFWVNDLEISGKTTSLMKQGVVQGSPTGEIEVEFMMPRHVKALITVTNSATGVSADVFAANLFEGDRRSINFLIRPPNPGDYLITLMINTPESRDNSFSCCVKIPMTVAQGETSKDIGFPQVWGHEHLSIRSPLSRNLKSAERAVFQVVELESNSTQGTLHIVSPTKKQYPLSSVHQASSSVGILWKADVGINERGDWFLVDLIRMPGGGASWNAIAQWHAV
ncbi:hypothetical protein PYCC9005_005298 [Savitreella phatthalungensis]